MQLPINFFRHYCYSLIRLLQCLSGFQTHRYNSSRHACPACYYESPCNLWSSPCERRLFWWV